MKISVGTKIAAGMAFAVALLVGLGIRSYQSTQALIEANRQARDREVREKLQGVLISLTEAESGARGYVITEKDQFLDHYRGADQVIRNNLESLRSRAREDQAQSARLADLTELINQRMELMTQSINVRKTDATKAAEIVEKGGGREKMEAIRHKVKDILDTEDAVVDSRIKGAESSGSRMVDTLLYGIPIAALLMAVGAYLMSRNISRPLRRMSRVVERVAQGDLTLSVESMNGRADEVGILQRTFATMLENLQSVTLDMDEASQVLTSSAQEIVASTTQLSSSAAETATAVSQTTTTVEEVRQTAQMSSQKARQVSDSAQKVAEISNEGRRNTAQTSEGMTRIRQQMDSIAQSMVRLSEQTQAIGQIITTVDDLAQQSNLLAVNASIEAAKAGEQGKGFAVVAQEVKSLAEQSKAATTQVRAILGDIQKASNGAVMATEQGSKAVEDGVQQSSAAGDSISSLAASISEAAQAAAQIAASSQQQLVGMEQVAQAMESIKEAAAQNVDGARQLERAASGLAVLGQRMKDLVGRYKLQDRSRVRLSAVQQATT